MVLIFFIKIFISRDYKVLRTSEIDFKDLFLDFIYLRDIEITNVRNIIEQFLIDKPTTYLVIGFLILNILGLFKYKFNLHTDELLFFVVLLNFILVNLLYISYWKNVEFESSYRYIVVCFHLIFISLLSRFSKFEMLINFEYFMILMNIKKPSFSLIFSFAIEPSIIIYRNFKYFVSINKKFERTSTSIAKPLSLYLNFSKLQFRQANNSLQYQKQ